MKLRFTGEWPPPDLWKEYPNWEPALEEEGEPGQDETTLRPGEEQRFVIGFGFTAGEVAPSVSLEDPSVFPLRVRSLLPARETGKALEFGIRADGSIAAG